MATSIGGSPGGRGVVSPRPKGRENSRNTICRNIGLFGHCRFENEGCLYNHNVDKSANGDKSGRRLNVDSPSFKPLQPASNGAARSTTISPKSANAAPFTPKTNTVTAANTTQTSPQSDWSREFREFVPQTFDSSLMQQADQQVAASLLSSYDPYSLASVSGMAGHQQQINPYATDPTSMAGSFFHQGANAFAQPAQYHNYAPMGPHRENLLPYQRASHDFFIPDKLREELQRKAEASLQTLPNSTLPVTVDHFHSLVPLDTNNQRNTTTFGYVTWAYKATSGKDGKLYALRRLEGYRLTNEKAILAVRPWKRINNGSVVSIHEAFTTRDFGDSSLIFVTDYHPNSKTLTETHLHHNPNPRFQSRAQPQAVSEAVLWSYLVQTASALKAIHSSGLAAQVISPSKVLLTSKNRIRLNGCGIVDLVKCDALPPVEEQQQDDFLQLGRLVLCIASNANATLNMPKALDHLTRHYSPRLKDAVTWLLHPPNTPANPHPEKNIDIFLTGIASEVTTVLDNTFHAEDTLYSMLMGELENGRLVRLMAKLGLINERPEYEHNEQWSETGERYYLKLFRDYVFHAVDENGRPVVDLGHIITCLNKLDAGSAELINLVSRDEQTSLIISYKELKKGIETAFNELVRGAARRG